MLILCPSCATSYQVEGSSLGAAGRSVRCHRCRTVWFAEAPKPEQEFGLASPAEVAAFETALADGAAADANARADLMVRDAEAVPSADTATNDTAAAASEPVSWEPSLDELMATSAPPGVTDAASTSSEARAAVEDGASPAPMALSEITIPVSDSPPLAPDAQQPDPLALQSAREDIESAAARRRRTRAAKPGGGGFIRNRLPMLLLVLVAVVAVLIGWRGKIVRQLPQTASFYEALHLPVNVRGVTFAAVKTTRDTHDGVPVLVVEGKIASIAAAPIEVPRLRFAVRNIAGQEVYAWTAMPSQTKLSPGEAVPFRSRLAAPPEDARDVMVRFFNRRDSLAGLR